MLAKPAAGKRKQHDHHQQGGARERSPDAAPHLRAGLQRDHVNKRNQLSRCRRACSRWMAGAAAVLPGQCSPLQAAWRITAKLLENCDVPPFCGCLPASSTPLGREGQRVVLRQRHKRMSGCNECGVVLRPAHEQTLHPLKSRQLRCRRRKDFVVSPKPAACAQNRGAVSRLPATNGRPRQGRPESWLKDDSLESPGRPTSGCVAGDHRAPGLLRWLHFGRCGVRAGWLRGLTAGSEYCGAPAVGDDVT